MSFTMRAFIWSIKQIVSLEELCFFYIYNYVVLDLSLSFAICRKVCTFVPGRNDFPSILSWIFLLIAAFFVHLPLPEELVRGRN